MRFFSIFFLWASGFLFVESCAESGAADHPPPAGDKDLTIGDSLFATPAQERLKKELALARNLARTIEQLNGVEAARVHLSLTSESILDRDAPKESQAAIVVTRGKGSRLSEQTIRDLAVAAVPRLEPNRVRVFLNEASPPPLKLIMVGPIEVAASSAFMARFCLGGLLLLSIGLAIGLIIAGIKIRRLRTRQRE